MILTCPECATSYFVDDDRIPAGGRKVKCANCGARWVAGVEAAAPDLDLEDVPPEPAEAPAPEMAPEMAAEPAAEFDAEQAFGDLEVAPAEAPLAAAPELPVRRAAPARAAGKGLSASLVALVVLAALALAAAAVVLLRGPIARAFPAVAPVFEALGLKARTTDLTLEGVHSQAAFQGETPVLTVTGAVRNAGREAEAAPPIRVRLRDRAGKVVAAHTATPVDAAVPAGATRYFAVILPNPPSTAAGLEVDFVAARPVEATQAAATAEAQP